MKRSFKNSKDNKFYNFSYKIYYIKIYCEMKNLKLDILLEKPKDKVLWIIFAINLILFLIFFLLLFPLLSTVFPPGYDLFAVKNAWTKAKMDEILGIWTPLMLETMILLHVWDFLFMAIYGLLLASGLILVARKLSSSEKLQKFYLIIFNFSWIAVLLDVIEGIFLYSIFFNTTGYSELSVVGANLSAMMCLVFFYPALILILIGFVIVFIKGRK
jgi:hypothetical protein